MRKRTLLLLLPLLALATPAHAQRATGIPQYGVFQWDRLYVRNTAAATVAHNPNWATTNAGCITCSPTGFADSSVFRRGATTLTAYDTTRAIRLQDVQWSPNFGATPSNALTDSSSLPWLFLRLGQDTTSYSFSGTSALDSARIAVEVSQDGITWHSCQGTPTQIFDVNFMTAGQDGLQSPSLIGVEQSPGEDMVQFVFKCHPSTAVSNSRIANRSLCMYNGWARFIIGMDGSGQFKVDAGTWVTP